jgi:PAS domain S-box-containing protein
MTSNSQSRNFSNSIPLAALYWSLIVIAGLAAAVVLATFWLASQTRSDDDWVRHSLTVRNQIAKVTNLMQDAASSQRDYLITDRDVYLLPYKNAVEKLPAALDELATMVADNPLQMEASGRLRKSVTGKLADMQNTLVERGSGQASSALAILKDEVSSRSVTEIGHLRSEMEAEEDRLLAFRWSLATSSSNLLQSSAVMSFLLICAAGAVFRRYEKRSFAALSSVLSASQDRLNERNLIIEACPIGIMATDKNGKIVLANAEIEKQFGYRKEELIGQRIDVLVPARARAEHVKHREGFTEKPESRSMGACGDLFGLRRDGTEFPVEVGLSPLGSGENLMVLSVIVDLSERRRIDRLKDEFVATVSHELRTPLTSISGSLGLLVGQQSGNLPEPAARLLVIAHKNSQRLVRLINDILDIEKVESDRIVFNLSRVEVRPLLQRAITENLSLAEAYGVHVRLDVVSVRGEVKADPDRLVQVVTNLLSNAIKFSSTDQEVLVSVEKRGDLVRISVRDHGSGIPAAFRSHIFEKFAQADSTNTRQNGGTGLGLSIVKQIVQRLDGEVCFDDALGGGTIFHVDLPAWKHENAAEIHLDAEADATRILLCDDDRETASAVREHLKAGFAVDFAYTMADAIERTEVTRYAAILVDLKLPDGDGVSLMLQIRAQMLHHVTPIIVIAGDPSRGISDVRSPRLNVTDWLRKPVDFENLVTILKAAIIPRSQIRPRILHVDDDRDVLAIVKHALSAMADVVSVETVKRARRAILADRIDLVLLDITLREFSGLDLLPELRDAGNAVPVVIYSAYGDGLACDDQIKAVLSKSNASLESLVTTIRDRLSSQTMIQALEAT